MSTNTWPGGHRRAMTQAEHAAWNREHYPGTLQVCEVCGEPTGRTEDTSLVLHDQVLCLDCYDYRANDPRWDAAN